MPGPPPPRHIDSGDIAGETRRRSSRGPRAGTPGWVKAFGIAAIGAIVVFVILHLTGVFGGPGMHAGGGPIQ